MLKTALLFFTLLSSTCYSQDLYTFYLSYGRTYALKGEFKKALDYYNGGIKSYPDSLAFYNGKGIVLEGLGDLNGSLEQFTIMTKLDSTSYYGFFNRARVYRLKKEYNKACDDYKTAYYLGHKEARLYFNNGCGFINDPDGKNYVPPITEEIKVVKEE